MDILGLTPGEKTIIDLLRAGMQTPLNIEKHSALSRQGAYKALSRLEKRGLVKSKNVSGSRIWEIGSQVYLEEQFKVATQSLLGTTSNINAAVKMYSGRGAVTHLLKDIFLNHKKETFVGLQGDQVYQDWLDILGPASINDINRTLKRTGAIIKAIVPEGHFKRAMKIMGPEWAAHFEGRSYRVNVLDNRYFSHRAEMFAFKKKIYFVSLKDELVIEVSNIQIVTLITSLLEFIQDNSKVIDGNETLRKLMNEIRNGE